MENKTAATCCAASFVVGVVVGVWAHRALRRALKRLDKEF
jgi:uncharacterized membrane-anchored protein YhcB (DUF1043 family)